MPALAVWMNGQRVGTWTQSRGGVSEFEYAQSWIESEHFRVISLSLPLTADRKVRGSAVTHYFDNLLPENPDVRKRISARFAVRAETFDLLTAIGRDCVGAVQLLPPDTPPAGWDRVEGTVLDEAEVAAHLRRVTSPARLGAPDDEDEFRISIAGVQEKTALLSMSGAWYRPEGVTPTTHILKLPLGVIGGGLDFNHSVENEWLCARFLKAHGVKVAEVEIGQFEDQKVLIVERFDRRWIGAEEADVAKTRFKPGKGVWIARLPQEDMCQALALPPEKKYENLGGPSMRNILQLLAGSETAATDMAEFVLTQLLFWLLAAPDGHAKNFSLRLEAGGRYRATPIYDVLSAWPIIGRGAKQRPYEKVSLAMALRGKNAHYRLHSIRPRHWRDLAVYVGIDGLWDRLIDHVNRAPRVMQLLEAELPRDFPGSVYDKIRKGVERHAKAFLRDVRDV
jgi:serine/threonine-protein kinase HipA